MFIMKKTQPTQPNSTDLNKESNDSIHPLEAMRRRLNAKLGVSGFTESGQEPSRMNQFEVTFIPAPRKETAPPPAE